MISKLNLELIAIDQNESELALVVSHRADGSGGGYNQDTRRILPSAQRALEIRSSSIRCMMP